MKSSTYLSVIFLFFLMSRITTAQETKKNVHSFYRDLKEKTYVLIDSPEIKHGQYQLIYYNKTIISGFYTNNNKTGIWKVYDKKGEIEFIYDYDKKEISNISKTYFNNPGDTLTRDLVYLGGKDNLFHFFYHNLYIPHEALNSIEPGRRRAVLNLLVDSNGNPNVVIGFSSGDKTFDSLVLEAGQRALDKGYSFLPAIQDGVSTDSFIVFPVDLTMSQLITAARRG